MIVAVALSATAQDYDLEAVRRYNMGLVQVKKGGYYSAISYFKEALDIQPDFYDAYYNIAHVYTLLGDEKNAIIYLEALLKAVPEDDSALIKLANIYYKTGETEKAIELANQVKADSPHVTKANQLLEKIAMENKAKEQYGEKPLVEKAPIVVPVAKKIMGINAPTGIAADANGIVFVASFSDNAIFKLDPLGSPVLYSKHKLINGPIGLAIDKDYNMYVANYNNDNILKLDKYGNVSVFIEHSPKPYSLYIKDNVLYISEQGSGLVIVRELE